MLRQVSRGTISGARLAEQLHPEQGEGEEVMSYLNYLKFIHIMKLVYLEPHKRFFKDINDNDVFGLSIPQFIAWIALQIWESKPPDVYCS